MRVFLLALQVLAAQLIVSSIAVAQPNFGQFKGEVVAKFLRDGRNMRLEQPFGYVDPKGQAWEVPAGTETDGASIPRVLWVSHPPFTGKYRAAAVVHDYYCQTKSRGWRDTHEVFYHAMRAAGVEDRTAKVMYAAVYYFGPRWGRGGKGEARATGAEQELPFEDQARLFEQLRSWIESESPDIEGIARRIDAGNLSSPRKEDRVALVLGNSSYQHAPTLENPKNDAADLSTALEKLGFKVITGIDLDKGGMERAIRDFARALKSSKVGLFFYAGHGLQVNGRNYLVPVDAKLEDASGLDFELIRLDLVQRTMEREANTNIVFLDACRDNPLARNLARSMGTRSTEIGRGLAAVESGVGTLISFSTQPGNVALDGTGRNSPFAGALVQQLLAGRGDLADMLISVRRSVMKVTANRQVPWEHSSLTDRFYFTAPSASGASAGLTYAEQAELAFWNAVKDSKQPAVIRSYLEAYPNGAFVVLAKAIVDQLENARPPRPAIKEAGPYDGNWQATVANNEHCLKRTHTFAIRIENGVIFGPLQQPGYVDASGNFRFKTYGAVNRAVLVEFVGKLSGGSGQGDHKTVGDLCAGHTKLTKLNTASAATSTAALASAGSAADPSPDPFDGRWRVLRDSASCRRNPKGEFVISIRNGRIQSDRDFGQVEADGSFEFRRDDQDGPGFGVFSGRLVGASGQGDHKSGWNGTSFTCGGQATLTKLDSMASADGGVPAHTTSKTTVPSAGPAAGPDAGPFDGRWRVVRDSPSCPRSPRSEFVVIIKDGLIRSGHFSGQVEADGRIDFKGEPKDGALGVFSGRLVGDAGQAEYKGGWQGASSFTCGGQATLTKLDAPTDASTDLPSDLPDDPKQLAGLLQRELQRVGCYPGKIDAEWGLGSRAAMSSFNLFTGMALPTDQPDPRAAAIVQKTLTRVCPADARAAAAPGRSAAQQPGGEPKQGTSCRLETLDECRARAKRSGSVYEGVCHPPNRQRVC